MEINNIVMWIMVAVVVIVIVLWIAFSVAARYEQKLSISMAFDETYRYVPNLNRVHKFKLDKIGITITGTMKKDAVSESTIIPGDKLKDFIRDNIIRTYKDSLIIQEANTFIVEENILKKYPIVKNPTLENLSIIFFNKLSPMIEKWGCKLSSVKIESEGNKVTHSRYKINTYEV